MARIADKEPTISPHWRRIAGIYATEEASIGAVWLALEIENGTIHCYDAAIFQREVPVVIGEGLNARGRWIPIAWEKKDEPMVDKLRDRGCHFLMDPIKEDDTTAEVMSREIWQRMRQSQFKLSRYAKNLREEIADMNRQDFSGNRDNYPLVGALRYAVDKINFAKAQEARKPQKNYPSKAIV